jgi:hypothetical protein
MWTVVATAPAREWCDDRPHLLLKMRAILGARVPSPDPVGLLVGSRTTGSGEGTRAPDFKGRVEW